MKQKLKVGILGATGTVGQRFISMLENHPWFTVTELFASEKSSRTKYYQSCKWKLVNPMPDNIKELIVKTPEPNVDCDLIFSSLPSSIAGNLEETFAKAGYPVISNSGNHRMDNDVPLIIPEINVSHLGMIPYQKKRRGYDNGFIITNPNCSVIILALALAPIHENFGIEKVSVTTMQALSGAGYPGVASLDVVDNVLPYINNEEDKMESEPQKIFGSLKNNKFIDANIKISAQCNRVNVSDGHLESVSIKLKNQADIDQFKETLKTYISPLKDFSLPSAPLKPVILTDEEDRPQPRLDREIAHGMAAVIGRIRECPVLDFKFSVLGHNVIRGAAGAAILNAEILKVKGYI